MALKPLKKFGQNYLNDKNIVNKMIQALHLSLNDSLIEIGPGKGFITRELQNKVKKIIGVEIDSRVIEELSSEFLNMQIIHADFVKIDLESLNLSSQVKIIGNIPFNQTGNILFKLIDQLEIIDCAVLIVPNDIARRIVATKRTKEYGILTVLFNYFSTASIVQKVSPNVFYPKPNLEAAILKIQFDKKLNAEIDNNLFIKIVKASFGNRRKTLNNSLRNSIFKDCDFSKLDLSLSQRAEELGFDDFLILTKYIQSQQCQKRIK